MSRPEPDNDYDGALREAWIDFCERLREAGLASFKESIPANEAQRVDAFRFLTQNLSQAFDLSLETRNPQFPLLHSFSNPLHKLGSDAADLLYHQAWIDGVSTYRIYGQRGSAQFINFTVHGARPDNIPGTHAPSLHEPFGDRPQHSLSGDDLEVDDDGHFELFIGGAPRPRNWLPTEDDTRKLFIRQGFDSFAERPAAMTIERVGLSDPPPIPCADTMIDALQWSAAFLEGVVRDWPEHPYRHSQGVVDPTQINRFPQVVASDGDDVKRGRQVSHLCWQLDPDDALVVSFPDHQAFWMVNLSGAMMNSLDYLYRPTSITRARAAVDRDGVIRLVIAHRDPGVENWLDTQGFISGNLTYRCFQGQPPETMRSDVVPLSDLSTFLPQTTSRCTAIGRQEKLVERFRSVIHRL